MKKMTIAASGLDGLIGSRVRELLENEFNFIDLNIRIMDITNRDNVDEVINAHEFDIFLHLAAYTNVDGAEEQKDLAKKINVDGTQYICDAIQRKNKRMAFMSTGFIFDGEHPPYFEDSQPHPISYYGETKYLAEKILQNRAMIVRIDYPYGGHVSYKKDLVESISDELKKGNAMKGIVDQIFTPTLIDDIAYALKHLFQHFSPEIYHIIGADSVSGYDIMTTICDVFGYDRSLISETTYDAFYKNRALRPKKSIMRSKKNSFYSMKTFEQGLEYLRSHS